MDNNVGMAPRYEREIPEGYEARIEGNKVIIEQKKSKDERIRKHIVTFLLEADKMGDAPEEVAKWIAYLERQKEQKPAELSEREERLMKALQTTNARMVELVEENYNLKESKQEWSGEDEEMIARICGNLEYLIKEVGCDSELKNKLEERIKWMQRLKSLHHSWKPSEEQMEELEYAIGLLGNMNVTNTLRKLYADLKKF